jgi:hypothetical protein
VVLEPVWFAFDFDLYFFHAVLNFLRHSTCRISNFTCKANIRRNQLCRKRLDLRLAYLHLARYRSGLHVYKVASEPIVREISCVVGPFVNEGEG